VADTAHLRQSAGVIGKADARTFIGAKQAAVLSDVNSTQSG